ncbi:Uncharacterised protein [Mycobacteroides abscessus subsp. abscessus]|nr:Uncharacterised protein [Mycobacteroides abscessus subsp. abscessus]
MPAAAIFFLARVMRAAMVDSDTRYAPAISGVVRPPSRRNVSATCASRDSAGWQHVKMSRRRSSRTGPTSSGSCCGSAKAPASRDNSSRRRSRRNLSMPRFRAVVVIQAPGLGGMPSCGHLTMATSNASCTASSARSILPK